MKQLKKSKRPVVLTVKGKAAAIVQDAEAYQRLLDLAAQADAGEGIRQGLEILEGKVRPAREFSEEFETRHGIRQRYFPRRTRPRAPFSRNQRRARRRCSEMYRGLKESILSL